MLALAENDAVDLVVATRYAHGGGTSNWHGARLWLSRAATRLVALILRTNISDPLSGYFLLRRAVWKNIRVTLHPSGFKLLLDIIAISPQLHHAETGYQFAARARGDSKLNFIVGWKFFMVLLRLSYKSLHGRKLFR
jgi:dolichol-phosphate mannosyltransferase